MKRRILESDVEALSHDGRGVARVDGKVFFVDLALPGERVRFQRGGKRRSFESGTTIEVLRNSPDRVPPPCEYFGVCGGCALQHMLPAAQIDAKQQQLQDNLERIGSVKAEAYAKPVAGPCWGYRRKARLGIRYVPKKGGVLVGFRERNKSYITPLEQCAVLDSRLSCLLPELKTLVAALSCYDRIPQIEAVVADNATALVFRHLQPLTTADLDKLAGFARTHGTQVYLQPEGPDSVLPLYPTEPEALFYRLEPCGVEVFFGPTDFIQVNAELNGRLVKAAMDYLNPGPKERVLDLFCGVGNFTLPIAGAACTVCGVEADGALVERARSNAALNNIDNATFLQQDLYRDAAHGNWLEQKYDKVLMDPPRTGAIDMVKRMERLKPERVVYISCNPATLARDAEVLVHKLHYRLKVAGVVDMFPHTTHVESIAVFERD